MGLDYRISNAPGLPPPPGGFDCLICYLFSLPPVPSSWVSSRLKRKQIFTLSLMGQNSVFQGSLLAWNSCCQALWKMAPGRLYLA